MLANIQRDGATAYRDFVDQYYEYVYRTAYAVLHHHQDTEDVVQDVFVQIYHSLPQYRGQGLKTWISRITVNKAIDARRRINRQLVSTTTDEMLLEHQDRHVQDDVGDSIGSSEEMVMKLERKRHIRSELDQIPEHFRDVIDSFYLKEKTYEEIAKEQGIEKKSVESRLYRARLWLKRHWRKEDFD